MSLIAKQTHAVAIGARRMIGAALALLTILLGVPRSVQAGETLRVVTEELPPYNMMRDGRVSGLGTEVVEALMKQVGVSAPVELMPWARAYETALTEQNVLIYSIALTQERAKQFKWVGEVTPRAQIYLYGLSARHLRLKSLENARGYRIATVNGDIGEQFLLTRGFDLGTNLSRSNKVESSYEKLKLGRVDLWIVDELTAPYIARNAGDDPAILLEQALLIPDVGGSEQGAAIAFGPNTPDALVARFRAGWHALIENGTFDAIQRKWR